MSANLVPQTGKGDECTATPPICLCIPFHGLLPVACSWKDGDPYFSIQALLYRRRKKKGMQWGCGEKEKAREESLPAGHPAPAAGIEASCGVGAGRRVRALYFPLQSEGDDEHTVTTKPPKAAGGKGEQRSLPLPSSNQGPAACLLYLVLLGFFFARGAGEALLLLLSFFPDLPPLSLSLLRCCCITSLAGPFQIDRERLDRERERAASRPAGVGAREEEGPAGEAC